MADIEPAGTTATDLPMVTTAERAPGHNLSRPGDGHKISRAARPSTSPTTAAFCNDDRPLVAVDWSFHGLHVTFDGQHVQPLPSMEQLLEQLSAPHRIVAESTFESWNPARKAELLAQLRAAGHELYVYRPIHTARNRPDGMDKTDANDARVIHAIATGGRLHLYPAPAVDHDRAAARTTANLDYQKLRLAGGKAQLTARAIELLGPYSAQTPSAQAVLGNGKTYSPTLLAAVMFAAQRAAGRAEFEWLLGLHGSAYPTLLRSEVHHHSFRHARKRGVSWQHYRRELRRAYQQLRPAA